MDALLANARMFQSYSVSTTFVILWSIYLFSMQAVTCLFVPMFSISGSLKLFCKALLHHRHRIWQQIVLWAQCQQKVEILTNANSLIALRVQTVLAHLLGASIRFGIRSTICIGIIMWHLPWFKITPSCVFLLAEKEMWLHNILWRTWMSLLRRR